MFLTQTQLRASIARWQAAGLIDQRGADVILSDLTSRSSRGGLIGAFGVMGGLLLVSAAISFVAAHWDGMPRLLRLSVLGGGVAASYAVAWDLYRRRLEIFAEAAMVVGIGLYGASIILVSQMYHLHGDAADAVALWMCGALAAGVLVRSNAGLGCAIALIATWEWLQPWFTHAPVHWAFLPAWAVAAAGVAITRWRTGMQALAALLSGWLVVTIMRHDADSGRYVVAALGIALAVVAATAGGIIDRWRQISPTMLAHGIILGFGGLLAVQFQTAGWPAKIEAGHLWLWGGITLALLCAAMAEAARTGNRSMLRLTYTFFGIEIFGLYAAKIGTLLGTSAFFFTAGVLLIMFAVVAHRLGLTGRSNPPGRTS